MTSPLTTLPQRFETLAVHGGQEPDPSTLSRGVPLHRTTAYVFKDAAHAARLFGLEEAGNIYTRLGNPTQAVLEERLALLEGGSGAVAFASGTAAIFSAIVNLARQGDEIVAGANLYGGTFTMLDAILPQLGIKTHFVDIHDLQGMEAAINERTRALYVEAIGNPSLDVADMEALSRLARKHGLPLMVDATFVTPYLLRPLEHGADIVVHSLSKWLGGHGTGIGGVVISGHSFDWSSARFDLYREPDASYHGLRWGHDLQKEADAFLLRLRTVPLRNLGACISPDNAWIFLQGLETLPLRMQRHSENALAVAQYLQKHPAVDWVRYPGLPEDPSHALAQKYLFKGCGGMVVFGLRADAPGGGKAAGQRFIDNIHLISHLANVGDAKSLAIHPGSTTHSQLTDAQQREAGLNPEMIRLSVGIEHIDDILADMEQALRAAFPSPQANG